MRELFRGESMIRRLLPFFVALVVAAPAIAATCSLQMEVTCNAGAGTAPGSCVATTTNTGDGSCSGLFYAGWSAQVPIEQTKLLNPANTLGLNDCFDSDEFGELGLEEAFAFCFGEAELGAGQSFQSTINATGSVRDVPILAITWVGDPMTFEERAVVYAYANVTAPSCTPVISAPPLAQSNADYTVSWTAVSDPTAQFIIEESTSADFASGVTSTQTGGLSKTFRHEITTATTYYYRVRPTNCAGGTPTLSRTTQTVVQPPPPPVTREADAAVPFGSTTPVQFRVFVPGASGKWGTNADTPFTASTDKPYLSVSPSSGTIPPQGTTLTVTANPTSLPPGANTGTLKLTTTGTANIPVSISLVTPVAPGTKTLPPPNAMVIPVVTHVNGAAGPFLSDVRLTNASGASVKYQITMTPTQTDGTQSSKVTQVTVDPESTVALNDIVKNFFGFGATSNPSDVGFGALEIRPLNTSSLLTYASSRTYASTINGTFGQFIAAVPVVKFATKYVGGTPIPGAPPAATPILSLQQIAQSTKFRTNLGIVEGLGQPANGRIRVLDNLGTVLAEIPFSLRPGEHRQMNLFIQVNAGITTLEDGRIEIIVDSDTGAVTAYASVLDNVTTDPLAVMPVDVSSIRATRYVLPGMADLPGDNNFHSDIRVYNGGDSDATINLTYYPQGNGTPVPAQARTIRKGEVFAADNVLPALFNATSTGGSIVITTASESSLVATGRTYTNVAGGGTYGQFIPGVTPTEGVGLGDRPLQVLQLEQSDRFRSNLGLAELTGNPVTVRLSVDLPDSIATPSTTVSLAANEFRQLGFVINQLVGPGTQSYNGRVVVEVLSGSGRVTAYGSVIDNQSKDPTYVPAQ